MIGRVICAKKVNRIAEMQKKKRPPKSSKNKMFVFGLCSTSDDQPSDPSKKKKQKSPPNKNKMFKLCSTSDDKKSTP